MPSVLVVAAVAVPVSMCKHVPAIRDIKGRDTKNRVVD